MSTISDQYDELLKKNYELEQLLADLHKDCNELLTVNKENASLKEQLRVRDERDRLREALVDIFNTSSDVSTLEVAGASVEELQRKAGKALGE